MQLISTACHLAYKMLCPELGKQLFIKNNPQFMNLKNLDSATSILFFCQYFCLHQIEKLSSTSVHFQQKHGILGAILWLETCSQTRLEDSLLTFCTNY
jgi:hypothetical protein